MKNLRRTLIPMLALVVVAIVAYPLYAQVAAKGVAAAKDLIKAMETDKITLAKAIETAEKHESGGKAVDAEAVMEGKDLAFKVYTVNGDKIKLVTVEGKTGKATKAEDVKEIGGKPEKAAAKEEPKKTEKAPAKKDNGKKPEPTKKP